MEMYPRFTNLIRLRPFLSGLAHISFISFGVRDFRFTPVLPMMPDAITQSATNPTVDVFEFDLNLRNVKIIHPSPLVYILTNTFKHKFLLKVKKCKIR